MTPYTFDRAQAGEQLDLMYGNDRGWVELAYIDGPPDGAYEGAPKPPAQTEGWYPWPAMRDQLLDKIGKLAECYGNVYVSVSLYQRSYGRKKEYGKRYVKPGRAILIDDARIQDATFTVETSPGNHQSWFLLDSVEDAATREQIARRAAYASGGDTGGWDATQLARIAGTHNTKRKCGEPFPIRLAQSQGPRHNPDKLLERWPATVERVHSDTSVNWHDVALQRGNLERLLNADHMPRRLSPKAFAHRVLTGDVVTLDRSLRRFWVCKGLAGVGYPDDEIAAILEELCDYGHTAEKGADWLREDITRCIAESRKQWADEGRVITITPSHGGLTQPAAPINDTPRKSRARKDRPQRITTLAYYEDVCRLADAMQCVNATRAEQAARYSVSIATIARIEHELTQQGLLKRHTIRKHGGTTSHLQVSRINIAAAPAPIAEPASELVVSHQHPQNSDIPHQDAENHDFETAPIEGTHRPDGSSPGGACNAQLHVTSTPVAIRLADAMRASIEAAAAEHGRVTKARVRVQFERFFDGLRWSDCEYERVMKRRGQETQLGRLQAWAQDAKTRPAELKRKARSLAYQHRRALEEGHSAKAYALGRQALLLEEEIEARILRGEIRRKVPKQTVIASQPELAETAEGKHPRGRVPSPRAVVLVKIPRKEPPTMVFDGRTVERLKALKQQRLAASGGGTL